MDNVYYDCLDREMRAILSSVASFSESEKNEVLRFIDVGEFGLALETLVGISSERNRGLEPEVLARTRVLLQVMGLGGEADSVEA